MTPLDELSDLLSGRSRAIVISEKEVDLRGNSGVNRVFVLKMVEGSLAAGGRGAGFGERRVTKVVLFALRAGVWEKLFETEDEGRVSAFEVPYYVSRTPFILGDGSETVGYGVVDPELVETYSRIAGE